MSETSVGSNLMPVSWSKIIRCPGKIRIKKHRTIYVLCLSKDKLLLKEDG